LLHKTGRTDVAGFAQMYREWLAQARGVPIPAVERLRAGLALVEPLASQSDLALAGRARALYSTVLKYLDDPDAAPLVLDAVRESTHLQNMATRARAARIGPDGRGRLPMVLGEKESDTLEEHARRRHLYALHLDCLGRALVASPGDTALQDEAFQVASHALEGELSVAIGQAAARSRNATADAPGTVELRYQTTELGERLRLLDAELWDARLSGHAANPARYAEAKSVRDDLRNARQRLRKQFTASLAFLEETSAPLAETIALLGEDEAVVAYVLDDYEQSFGIAPPSYVRQQAVVVRRSGLTIVPLPDADRLSLARDVAAVRAALVPPKVPADILDVRSLGAPADPLAGFPFDTTHRLFERVLKPAMPALAGVRPLMIVPDGALAGLPFAVLLPELPAAIGRAEPDWLIRRMALSTLPSLQSLPALRSARLPTPGPAVAFIGFGAPLFRGAPISSEAPAAGGQLASVLDLAPVPETADELGEIARSLGADVLTTLHLHADATKAAVRAAPLGQARVVAFATHGLLRREVKGLYEPALALTPGSAPDDGLLTASEIASLRFSADWVLLLACNTAIPDDTADGDQLSSLARAFLYAGARNLLVSQWAVAVDATKFLTTSTIVAAAAAPESRKAEALAITMRAMAEGKGGSSLYRHPYFWAPFIVVGDGGSD